MAKRKSTAATNATKATRYAGNVASKAITGLGRWAVTDHTGTAKLLANLPPMGWIDTLITLLVTAVLSLLGAVASAAMLFLLVAVGIPLLLSA